MQIIEKETISELYLERTTNAIKEFNQKLNSNIRNLEICINKAIFNIQNLPDGEEKTYWISEKLRFETELVAFDMASKSLSSTMKNHRISAILLY